MEDDTDSVGDGEDVSNDVDKEEVSKINLTTNALLSVMSVSETYGTLLNGDFEEADPDNSYKPANWDVDWTGFTYKTGNDMDGYGYYTYWWVNSKSTISIS